MYEDTRLKMRPCIRLCRIDSERLKSRSETCFQQTGSITSQDEINSSLPAESHSESMNHIKGEIKIKRESGPTTEGCALPTDSHHASPKSHIQQPTAEFLDAHLNKISASDFIAENLTDRNEFFTLRQVARLRRSTRNTRSLVQLCESLSKKNQVQTTANRNEIPTQKKTYGKHKISKLKIQEIQVQCPLCDKTFSHSANLRRHKRRVHLKIYNYKYDCEDCELRFTARYKYVEHRRRYHTFEKPFQCHICQKRHCTRAGARNHLLNHTGIKPVTCKKCGQLFAWDSNLKTHLRTCTAKRNAGDMSKYGVHLISVGQKKSVHTSGISDLENSLIKDKTKCGNEWTTQKNFPNCTSSTSRSPDRNEKFRSNRNELQTSFLTQRSESLSRGHDDVSFEEDHSAENKTVQSLQNKVLTGEKHANDTNEFGDIKPTCRICKKMFSCESGLLKHLKHVHLKIKNYKYNCEICGERFMSRIRFLEHGRRYHTFEKPFQCPICSKHFYERHVTRIHIKDLHGVKPFTCKQCGQLFAEEDSMKSHQIGCKNKRISSEISPSFYSLCYSNRLKNCDLNAEDSSKKCAPSESVHSEAVNVTMHDRDSSLQHLHVMPPQTTMPSQHENHESVNIDIQKLKPGNVAVRVKSTRATSNRHTVRLPVDFRCKICNMLFESRELLTQHRPVHKSKWFQCDVCSMLLTSVAGLRIHKKHVHDRDYDRKYVCDSCGQRFYVKNACLRHIGHCRTGEKPSYACHLCEKSFASAFTLRAHQINHSGQLPHKCKLCGKGFPYLNPLMSHLLTHSGVAQYSCPICRRPFVREYDLKCHRKSVMPRSCNNCPELFCTNIELELHLKICQPVSPKHVHENNLSRLSKVYKLLKNKRNVRNTKESFGEEGANIVCEQSNMDIETDGSRTVRGLQPDGENQIICDFCGKVYGSKMSLYHHRRAVHLRNFRHACEFCAKRFYNIERYRNHVNSHTGKKPYGCDICKRNLSSKGSLRTHMLRHQKLERVVCAICNKSFSSTSVYKYHVQRIHLGGRSYTCDICQKTTTTKSNLRGHMRSHTQDAQEKKTFQCERCSKWFVSSKGRDDHVNKACPVGGCYICRDCMKPCASKRMLLWHMEQIHKEPMLNRLFACTLCSKRFELKFLLADHMITHGNEKPFQCSHCQKAFFHEKSLKIHLISHQKQQNFVCSECSTKFKYSSSLSLHRRKYCHASGTYLCRDCPSKFATKEALTSHFKRKHISNETPKAKLVPLPRPTEKLYECEVCFKSFAYKQVLETHMNSHAGKQFKCENCSKLFTYKNSLWLHMKKCCHSKNLYRCEVCFKDFAYKQVLETHMNSHAGKQFKCENCSKPFTYKNSLWLHMKKYCHSKNLS